jgi:hypothetical protein
MTTLARGITVRSLGTSAIAGALAYLLGYVVVYAWQGPNVEEQLTDINAIVSLLGGEQIAKTEGVAWLFYNAHFVRTQLGGQNNSVNFIAEADGGELLYLVPILALLVAGLAVAVLSRVDDPLEGAAMGTLLTVGYLPAAIGGAVVFRYNFGDGAIQPELVTAIGLAGLLYPLLIGAIGGALGAALSN